MRYQPFAACAVAAFCLSPAAAQITLDQQQNVSNGIAIPFGFGNDGDNLPVGQAFTAGLSGTFTGFQVTSNYGGENTSDVTFEVRQGADINGTLLGTLSQNVTCVENGDGFCIFSFDTSGLNITLTAGQQYAFDFTSANGVLGTYGVLGTSYDSYAGGRAIPGVGYGNGPSGPNWDLEFKTFVDVGGGSGPGVPEPASWAMLVAGFGLTGAAMRRRKIFRIA